MRRFSLDFVNQHFINIYSLLTGECRFIRLPEVAMCMKGCLTYFVGAPWTVNNIVTRF